MLMNKPSIIFTGGGSAGHVIPCLPIIDECILDGFNVAYIGQKKGIENTIINSNKVQFYSISSGKFRRYFSWKNLLSPMLVILGIMQSIAILIKIKPRLIFSKGGFVAVPVAVAGRILGIPIITHESDVTPGLATKIIARFASKVCLTFDKSKMYFKNKQNLIVTGMPIRNEIMHGDKEKGLSFLSFKKTKSIILVIGGGLGSKFINNVIRLKLNNLLNKYNIIHICGKGNIDYEYLNIDGYKQVDYLAHELPHVLACSDLVISRAGSNILHELIYLQKKCILIPLSKQASRGEQIQNVEYYKNNHNNIILYENKVDDCILNSIINLHAREYNSAKIVYDTKEIINNIKIIINEYR